MSSKDSPFVTEVTPVEQPRSLRRSFDLSNGRSGKLAPLEAATSPGQLVKDFSPVPPTRQDSATLASATDFDTKDFSDRCPRRPMRKSSHSRSWWGLPFDDRSSVSSEIKHSMSSILVPQDSGFWSSTVSTLQYDDSNSTINSKPLSQNKGPRSQGVQSSSPVPPTQTSCATPDKKVPWDKVSAQIRMISEEQNAEMESLRSNNSSKADHESTAQITAGRNTTMQARLIPPASNLTMRSDPCYRDPSPPQLPSRPSYSSHSRSRCSTFCNSFSMSSAYESILSTDYEKETPQSGNAENTC